MSVGASKGSTVGNAILPGLGTFVGAGAGAAVGVGAGAFGDSVEKFGKYVGLLPTPAFNGTSPANKYETFQGGGSAPTLNADGTAVGSSLGDISKRASDTVAFLGSAATASDRYAASVAKLNLEVSNNSSLTDLQAKAMRGLDLDRLTSEQNSYVSALGEFATTQDKVTQASLNFQKTQLQNPRLTNDQRTAVVALTEANDEWTKASTQAQLGVFDLSTATKAANDQFKAQQAPGGYLDHATPDQLAAAYQAYANKVSALGDAAKVAGSAFPQLTQLGLDAANANKQFDTFATTSLNDLSDGLVSITSGASSAGAAFANFGNQVVASLEKMIIQLTIIRPLAQSIGTLVPGFGSLTASSGGGVAGTIKVGSQSFPSFGATGYHTGGIVGSEPTFGRYVHPSYFDDAPRFHTGGIAGNEVPIIAQRGEGVFTPGQMAAMGGGASRAPNVTVINNSGTQSQTTTAPNGDVTVLIDKKIDAAVGKSLSSGTGMRVLSSQYGVNQFAGQ